MTSDLLVPTLPDGGYTRLPSLQTDAAPIERYTPIFAMSRVGGWVAHVLEYQEDNRLIRPRARYVGPDDQEFVRLNERGE